jgi:hypothetical protein
MTIDRWVLDLATVIVVAIAIGIGLVALDGHARLWLRVVVVVTTTVVTYGAAYLALVAVLHPTETDPGPWLAWPPTPIMTAAILVLEAVIWLLAMLLAGRRRAERQGRFHPEYRLPFQRPF